MRYFVPLAAFLTPAVAFAAAPRTFNELANLLVTILDYGAGILVVLAIVIYFYSVSTGIYKARTGEATTKLRTTILWGILVIFVMVSIWGIIEVLQNTIFGNDRYSPSTGQDGVAPASFNAPTFAE